eukprot:3259579-Rhodomonas_salina.1
MLVREARADERVELHAQLVEFVLGRLDRVRAHHADLQLRQLLRGALARLHAAPVQVQVPEEHDEDVHQRAQRAVRVPELALRQHLRRLGVVEKLLGRARVGREEARAPEERPHEPLRGEPLLGAGGAVHDLRPLRLQALDRAHQPLRRHVHDLLLLRERKLCGYVGQVGCRPPVHLALAGGAAQEPVSAQQQPQEVRLVEHDLRVVLLAEVTPPRPAVPQHLAVGRGQRFLALHCLVEHREPQHRDRLRRLFALPQIEGHRHPAPAARPPFVHPPPAAPGTCCASA